jgi:hypothetical protein
MLTLPHLGKIKAQDIYLGDTIERVQRAVNQMGKMLGVDPTGTFPTPTAPAQVNVTSVAGGFDVAIVDANPQRLAHYFLDFSADAGFAAPRTVFLGTSRNIYLPLGQATLFFGARAQHFGSDSSDRTVFGGNIPTAVTGGAPGTPTLQPSQGTGAGTSRGANVFPPTGGGFGPVPRINLE